MLSIQVMKKTSRLGLMIGIIALLSSVFAVAVVHATPSNGSNGPLINNGHASCYGTLSANGQTGDYFLCPPNGVPYNVLTLSPYLSTTSPSGYSLYVGYCIPGSGGSCTAHYQVTSAGHYGMTFSAGSDSSVFSFYGNFNSVQVAYTATDYYTWN